MALAGKVAGLYTSSGNPVAFTNEATTADTGKTRYTITNASKRYWPLGSAPTVKVNGSATALPYTIEYAGGVVVFATALTTETVTVTGTYVAVAEVAGWYAWKSSTSQKTQEVTDFIDADAGFETHMLLPTDHATLSANRYFTTTDYATASQPLLFKCFIDTGTSKARYEGWGVVTSQDIDASTDKVIDESVSAVITGGLYYREG